MTEARNPNTEPDWSEYRGVLVVVEQREEKPGRFPGSCWGSGDSWPRSWRWTPSPW